MDETIITRRRRAVSFRDVTNYPMSKPCRQIYTSYGSNTLLYIYQIPLCNTKGTRQPRQTRKKILYVAFHFRKPASPKCVWRRLISCTSAEDRNDCCRRLAEDNFNVNAERSAHGTTRSLGLDPFCCLSIWCQKMPCILFTHKNDASSSR